MLEVQGLTIAQARKSIDHISFSVAPGEIYGLYGDLLAARLLFYILAGLETAREGSFRLGDGQARMGAFFCNTILYTHLTLGENLRFFAKLYSIPNKRIDSILSNVADKLGLTEHWNMRAVALPFGAARLAMIARAFLHQPEVMILEQPFSGLNPVERQAVERYLLACKQEGKTVLLCDGDAVMLEQLCDRVGILKNGKLIDQGPPAELIESEDAANLYQACMRLLDEGVGM